MSTDAIVTLEPLMCVPKNLAPLVRQVTATQASYTTVFTTPWMKTTDTYFASSESDFANEGMPFAPWVQPCS